MKSRKFRRLADPPSCRFGCEGARFIEIPPDLPKFSQIATYLARMVEFSTSRFCGRSRRIFFTESWVKSAVRGPAARPVRRRRGEIQRNAAQSVEIQRNRHLHGAKGRNCAPREYAADCVGVSSGNPEKNSAVRRSATRHVLRLMGEILGGSARPAEIQRNRHLLGTKGWNLVPRDSAVDCVEISPSSPEKFQRFADSPPGRFFGEWARFVGIPPDLSKFSEIATYLVRRSDLAPRDSVADCVEISS